MTELLFNHNVSSADGIRYS